jgi:capsular polysaccharide transport system permease protein
MQPQTPSAHTGLLAPDTMRARRFRTTRTVVALVLREMATTHGRSPGGYLWSIVDPVAALGLMSVVFQLALNKPPIGTSFMLFYATGYLPFVMFNDVANKMATSIKFSRPLLAYPAVTFLDALVARFLLNVLTHLMVAYIIFGSLILIFDARSQVDLPSILLGFSLIAMLGIGIGTLNCYLMTAYPLWERTWHILTRPLFLVSGIFFLFGTLPDVAKDVLWYNPIIHAIGMIRSGFYATYDASYVSVGYVMAISSLTFLMGLLLLWRHHRFLLEQ